MMVFCYGSCFFYCEPSSKVSECFVIMLFFINVRGNAFKIRNDFTKELFSIDAGGGENNIHNRFLMSAFVGTLICNIVNYSRIDDNSLEDC